MMWGGSPSWNVHTTHNITAKQRPSVTKQAEKYVDIKRTESCESDWHLLAGLSGAGRRMFHHDAELYLHLSCFKKQTLRSLSMKNGIRRQIRFNWKCLFWWHEGFVSHFSIQVNIVVTSASCSPTESRLKSNLNLICSVCLRRFHIEIDDVFLCVCVREFILFMNADFIFFCLIHSAGIRMENDGACWT